jgi:sensor histidine kinase regulating citrate/malate metabolism
MWMRRRQRGLSMMGFLFVAVVVVACVMIGFRVMPAYIEHYSVQKALEEALATAKDLNSTAEIRNAFQRRADAGYIESVQSRDIEVTKSKNEVTASVEWTRKLPLVANVSLWLEFEASATRR